MGAGRAAFDDEERDEQHRAHHARDRRRFDQGVDNTSESGGGQKSAGPIEFPAVFVRSAFRDAQQDQQDHAARSAG